ncbi:helix-turn-helix domain-containing protein [Streptococcus sp. 121]|uniref:helix-turn-helix domain-containing protein n=1 Tax=Streptococcus sp. 121 TaxID=2797637 RepID=UPI0018F0737E|nr:XRE family transcriptional regulator [Streptococcus sp. 121]MBJ6745082.1 helix-turn-helix domain-containing protein [Streptococcus sp. 121]
MINKEELGLRIRQEREKQGLSREALCGDEAELTVRQLLRIETGKSLPKLEKLEFLSRVLGADISTFLGEEKLDIPAEYFDLKYKLFKSSTYGDLERLEQKRQLLEQIYESYYHLLPEEELFSLDILERIWDFIESRGVLSSDTPDILYEDYQKQLLLRKIYDLNDLLLLSYHFMCRQNKEYELENFTKLEENLLIQTSNGDEFYNRELLNCLSLLIGAHVARGNMENILKITEKMEGLVELTAQHTYYPLILTSKAKYYRYYENNLQRAKELYSEALVMAKVFGDQVFLNHLESEMRKDL